MPRPEGRARSVPAAFGPPPPPVVAPPQVVIDEGTAGAPAPTPPSRVPLPKAPPPKSALGGGEAGAQ
eukprot:2811623-Alexandrium_andersonii.AAC.1